MEIGRSLILLGLIVLVLGLVLTYIPGALRWFGKIPGDFSYKGENVRIYFPFASMLIVSIILSILLGFFRR